MSTKKNSVAETNNAVENQNAVVPPVLIMPCFGCIPVVVGIANTKSSINYGDYHKMQTLIPAWKKPDGVVVSVENGLIVAKGDVIWDLISGAYFENKDGEKFLLSRKLFGERELFWLTGAEAEKPYMHCQKMHKPEKQVLVDIYGNKYRYVS